MILSALAEADLEEIWLFSADRWGPDQADRYTEQLAAALRELGEGKRLNRPAGFVKPGLRKARCQRHFIYFREDDAQIVVSRILHESMDATLHIV